MALMVMPSAGMDSSITTSAASRRPSYKRERSVARFLFGNREMTGVIGECSFAISSSFLCGACRHEKSFFFRVRACGILL